MEETQKLSRSIPLWWNQTPEKGFLKGHTGELKQGEI